MKRLILWGCVLATSSSLASAWFKDKIVQNKNADVSVTIMRWGVPDDDLSAKIEDKKDRFVGQVASDKYQTVTLVFESVPDGGMFFRLPVTTGVHVFTEGRDSYCTLCPRGRKDGYGGDTNAKGAKTSGGCFFELFMPRQQNLRKLRLVDVLAQGESVYYFTKFNVSCDLLKSPTRVPVSKRATLHPVECSLETVDVNGSSVTGKAKQPDGAPDTDGVGAVETLVSSSVMAGTVTVTDDTGKPVKDADVYYIRKDNKMHVSAKTDEKGLADLKTTDARSVTVFCAHPSYAFYRKSTHSADKPLAISLRTKKSTGSVVFPNGTGYVPGLIGRLNPILDTENRLYMYADNIALDGGQQQPVYFQLMRPIRAEDRDGNLFELTVVDVIGETSLIEFQKK